MLTWILVVILVCLRLLFQLKENQLCFVVWRRGLSKSFHWWCEDVVHLLPVFHCLNHRSWSPEQWMPMILCFGLVDWSVFLAEESLKPSYCKNMLFDVVGFVCHSRCLSEKLWVQKNIPQDSNHTHETICLVYDLCGFSGSSKENWHRHWTASERVYRGRKSGCG